MRKLPHIFENNRKWAEDIRKQDPEFFSKLTSLQTPKYLWIGCSDSRVPANEITGLLPGEVFVHRNVGNLVYEQDINCMSVIHFGVHVLGVEHIIVCGHYGCGAIQAVWENKSVGFADSWLSSIYTIKENNKNILSTFSDTNEKIDKLCQVNVLTQAINVCNSEVVQSSWEKGNSLTIHAWIYRLSDGRLQDLGFSVSSLEELEETLNK
jgi:carbonic anhydrase